MEGTPCRVCGGTDSNLVDGYYYCVECGTQDVTVRETVLEYIAREDGTFAHTTSKKIVSAAAVGRELSPEWYKWHIYNFIMAGLADELVALGAGEGFKLRLLWLWTKYIKQHKEKDDSLLVGTTELFPNSTSADNSSRLPDPSGHTEPVNYEEDSEDEDEASREKLIRRCGVGKLNMLVMQAMLYAALNASESEIQIGDLLRFIKEDRVSCKDCLRFVPSELNYGKVFSDDSFSHSCTLLSGSTKIRGSAMSLYKILKLGKPPSANIHKLVDRYVTELCLPGEFKDFVYSLMLFIPVSLELDFLHGIHRTPDYEGVAMSYIIIAMKMCFGLDDNYEYLLSDAVDIENKAKSHSKAFKNSLFMDGADRLFSFREWSVHMEFRKQVIAKYYFPASVSCKSSIDSQVFISHTKNRVKREVPYDVSEEVMMEMLDKLNGDIENFNTPKIHFPASLTPFTTYTDVLLRELDNPLLKELLGEDFSQYSIKYMMDLEMSTEIQIAGISLDNVNIIPSIPKQKKMFSNKLVFVKNCENDNWLVTKPPNATHLDLNEDDNSYSNNNCEETLGELTEKIEAEHCHNKKSRNEHDESVNKLDCDKENIFDDDFNVTKDQLYCNWQQDETEEINEIVNDKTIEINYSLDPEDSFIHLQNGPSTFDPVTFDREKAIERLLEIARKEYKIKIPTPRVLSKRKNRSIAEKLIVSEPKRIKVMRGAKYGEAKAEVKEICQFYYAALGERKKYAIDTINDHETSSETHAVENNKTLAEELSINDELGEICIQNKEEENQTNECLGVLDNESVNLDYSYQRHNDEICNKDDNNSCDLTAEKINSFDQNIFDTKQLYLKFKGIVDDNTIETEEHSDIIDLLRQKDKNMIKFKKHEKLLLKDIDCEMLEDSKVDLSITKDEIPDNVDSAENASQNSQDTQVLLGQTKLLDNESYNYWIHNYYTYVPYDFEKELDMKFSRSFAWVLRLCASMIECTTRTLYNHVLHLESDLKTTLGLKLKESE